MTYLRFKAARLFITHSAISLPEVVAVYSEVQHLYQWRGNEVLKDSHHQHPNTSCQSPFHSSDPSHFRRHSREYSKFDECDLAMRLQSSWHQRRRPPCKHLQRDMQAQHSHQILQPKRSKISNLLIGGRNITGDVSRTTVKTQERK